MLLTAPLWRIHTRICLHAVSTQVTPLSSNVQRIPYPIPPAGADPATYRAEEEPPPLGYTMPFTPHMVLLDSPNVQVRVRGLYGLLLLPPLGYIDIRCPSRQTHGAAGQPQRAGAFKPLLDEKQLLYERL